MKRAQANSNGKAAFLSLVNATFRLGDRLVFENTNWTIRRGEQWAIVGPNGSGKSLLADALRGRLPSVGGEMIYHFKGSGILSPEQCIGHVAFDHRKQSLHGAVVQSRWNSSEEDSERTVADFLSYDRVMGVNPFEVTKRHDSDRPAFVRRASRAIRLLGLRRFLQRDLLSLSHGESQKVHLARALALPLRLLILDDPFSGLDKESRASFLRNLRKLMKSRLQIILLSTRAEDLLSGITHLLRVKDCRMISVGPKHGAARIITNRDHSAARARRRASNSKPATEPLVELRNVTVRYGRAIILKGVNWKVQAGQSWALLGPNGSGKTTLLSLLLGDHPQVYQNDVRLFGKLRGAGESIWELKQRIGWVSPEMHLHFDETVTCFEAVASGFHDTVGLFKPLSRAQEKSTRLWLKRFDLEKSANEPLFALSAGQQRMALLARALVKNPQLLVLDEPCQGLDSAHRQLFLRTIDRLLRQGKETAIYVTHCEDEIPRSITRVLRLSNGRARVVS